jgi:hypothetical protein
MTQSRGGAARLLWPALTLGVAADVLFRADDIGLNVALWLAVAVLAWWSFRLRDGESPGPAERALLAGIFCLGLATMWRENETLRLLNGVALIASVALLPVLAAPDGAAAFWNLSVVRFVMGVLRLIRRTLIGLIPVIFDANRSSRGRGTELGPTMASVARGTILTVPALVIFGGLLGHADRVFGDFLEGLVRFDVDRLLNHSLAILGASWLAAAALGGALTGERDTLSREPALPAGGLGRVEIGMLLGLVNLLFAGFIAFQLPYLFGGAAWVERTAGITLAEYARQGFFELVVVSALVLPLLVILHARLRPGEERGLRLFHSLAAWQVILVLTMMASAIHRMALYQREFGLTEDRFFASAFMGGLAVTFCWFGGTVLRGRAERFVGGAVIAWAGWLVLLHAINPERVIVETNIARAESGKPLDAAYLTRLSSDAAPALVHGMNRMPRAQQEEVKLALRRREASRQYNWRSWHFGRAVASELIARLD